MARYGRDYRPRGRGYDRPYYGYGRGGYYGATMYGGGRYGEDFSPGPNRYRGARPFTGGALQG